METFLLGTVLPSQPSESARVHAWKADIHAFAMHLVTDHPNPFRWMSRDLFEARLQELDQSIGCLEDHEIAARWSSLIAALGDEHTDVDFEKELGNRRLPIAIKSFGDGLFIVKTTVPYRHLLGARLERVEQVGLDHIQQTLKMYVAYHQKGWYQSWFEDSFDRRPMLMEAAGLAKVKASWSIRVALKDGKVSSDSVDLFPVGDIDRQRWVEEALPGGVPIREQDPGRPYFFKALRQDKALYFRFRRCDSDPDRPFLPLVRRMLNRMGAEHLTKLVVDLRGNSGGKESMVDRLLGALKERTIFRRPGRLVVLTDGGVFSSGAVAAWRLKHQGSGTLIGEACGAAVNHVGAVFDVPLPSGRVARWGTETHVVDREHPDDFMSPISPDVPIILRHADVVLGRDPLIEAALSYGHESGTRKGTGLIINN